MGILIKQMTGFFIFGMGITTQNVKVGPTGFEKTRILYEAMDEKHF